MIAPTILCRFSDKAEEARRRARQIKRELEKPTHSADFSLIMVNAEWLADWLLIEPNAKLILDLDHVA